MPQQPTTFFFLLLLFTSLIPILSLRPVFVRQVHLKNLNTHPIDVTFEFMSGRTSTYNIPAHSLTKVNMKVEQGMSMHYDPIKHFTVKFADQTSKMVDMRDEPLRDIEDRSYEVGEDKGIRKVDGW